MGDARSDQRPRGAAEWQARADQHRPRTRDEMRVAVHELRARGLSPVDIERALRLHPTEAADLLRQGAR